MIACWARPNGTRCKRDGTVWAHFQWWCTPHTPSTAPDPNCTHSLTSVFFGVVVCSWCAGHLEAAPTDVPRMFHGEPSTPQKTPPTCINTPSSTIHSPNSDDAGHALATARSH